MNGFLWIPLGPALTSSRWSNLITGVFHNTDDQYFMSFEISGVFVEKHGH